MLLSKAGRWLHTASSLLVGTLCFFESGSQSLLAAGRLRARGRALHVLPVRLADGATLLFAETFCMWALRSHTEASMANVLSHLDTVDHATVRSMC